MALAIYYDRDLFEIEGNTLVKYIGGDQQVVVVPEGVEIIGEAAFACLEADVEEVVLPSTIKHIRKSAFDASRIYSINFPEGLISIGDFAFNETNLSDISLPSTLVRIGTSVFTATELEFVDIDPNNNFFALRGDAIYDLIDRKIIAGFGDCRIEGDDIDGIAEDAFYSMSTPEEVTIPEGVKWLGENCFSFCDGLETVHLPSSLNCIGKSAFSCSSIKSIIIPSQVETIGEEAFYNCTSLENVDIEDGVKRIKSGAFSSCKKIKNITIPASVTAIEDNAFINNDSLETIYCAVKERPSGWNDNWNHNAEWHTTFMGRPVHGGCNTRVVWGATEGHFNSNTGRGLYLDFDNRDICIKLESAKFDCELEECELTFYVENKTNKDMRIWLTNLCIGTNEGEEEVIDEYNLITELGAHEFTRVEYTIEDSMFSSLVLAPACMEDNPYDTDECCANLCFDISYDFGSADVGKSSWYIDDFEIEVLGEYEGDYDEEEDDEEDSPIFTTDSILYIYKGNIRCHRYGHNLIQATAILHNKTDNKIILNVEYCTECKKFILEYTVFEEYRRRYGVLVGNFRMVVNGEFDSDYDLAEESPLMLSGYNVSQKDGYTSKERHYILARIIHDRIMDKGDVIRYLSYFIRKNGAKRGNEMALSKWREDLEFVQNYNINTQPSTIISDIRKY